MVVGQEIEEIGAGVVELVLGVVVFRAEGAGEFAEVEGEAFTDGRDVGAVGLEDVAVDIGAELVLRAALEGFGGLAELEVSADAEALAGGDVGRVLDDERELVDAEAVTGAVISAEEIDAADGVVEVVGVVAVEATLMVVPLRKSRVLRSVWIDVAGATATCDGAVIGDADEGVVGPEGVVVVAAGSAGAGVSASRRSSLR